MANVMIDIAAEFVGAKAFKQADTATDKLTKNVKTLAKTLGIGLSVGAVVAFGKASVKAFAEDEAAATRLSKAVTNLGLGFEDTRIKAFIADLESTAFVADDVLRPAFQSLLTTTGSVAKSQELLKLALDVSAGSSEDLATVSNDLALAYVGQTKGLKKYDLGLSAAELTTANFEEIQKKLNSQFAGQNAARLDTYAGKMEAVNLAFNNAQETVGGGLLDAFSILGGENGIGSVTTAIDGMAAAAAESITSLALVIKELEKIPVIGGLLDRLKNPLGLPQEFLAFGKGGLLDQFRELSKESKQFGGIYATKYLGEVEKANAAARKKAEEEAARRAKELLGFKNKQLANEKAQLAAKKLQGIIDKGNLALAKGSDVFDLEKIQLQAAEINQAEQLGKATNAAQLLQIGNDTARLNVKKSMLALEDAIAAKDEAAIIAATKRLEKDVKSLDALTGQNTQLATLKSILEGLQPKKLIDIQNLKEAIDLLNRPPLGTAPSAGNPLAMPESLNPIKGAGGVRAPRAFTEPELKYFDSAGDYLYAGSPLEAMFGAGGSGSSPAPINITVQTGVGDPNAIAEAIDNVLREARQRGTLLP
jgi:hypothetical protein